MTRYDVTGPHVSRGVSTWLVWERPYGGFAQTLSAHASEAEAKQAALEAAIALRMTCARCGCRIEPVNQDHSLELLTGKRWHARCEANDDIEAQRSLADLETKDDRAD